MQLIIVSVKTEVFTVRAVDDERAIARKDISAERSHVVLDVEGCERDGAAERLVADGGQTALNRYADQPIRSVECARFDDLNGGGDHDSLQCGILVESTLADNLDTLFHFIEIILVIAQIADKSGAILIIDRLAVRAEVAVIRGNIDGAEVGATVKGIRRDGRYVRADRDVGEIRRAGEATRSDLGDALRDLEDLRLRCGEIADQRIHRTGVQNDVFQPGADHLGLEVIIGVTARIHIHQILASAENAGTDLLDRSGDGDGDDLEVILERLICDLGHGQSLDGIGDHDIAVTVLAVMRLESGDLDLGERCVLLIVETGQASTDIIGVSFVATVPLQDAAVGSVDLDGGMIEDICADRGDIPFKGSALENGTLGKGIISDGIDARRHHDAAQLGTTVESILADGRESSGEGDLRQIQAVLEGTIADLGDGIGDHDLLKLGIGKAHNLSDRCVLILIGEVTQERELLLANIRGNDELGDLVDGLVTIGTEVIVVLGLRESRRKNVRILREIGIVEVQLGKIVVDVICEILRSQTCGANEFAFGETVDRRVAVGVYRRLIGSTVQLYDTEITYEGLLLKLDMSVRAVVADMNAPFGSVNDQVIVIFKDRVLIIVELDKVYQIEHEVSIAQRGREREGVILDHDDVLRDDLAHERRIVGESVGADGLDVFVNHVVQRGIGSKVGMQDRVDTLAVLLQDHAAVIGEAIHLVILRYRHGGQILTIQECALPDLCHRSGDVYCRELDTVLESKVADLLVVLTVGTDRSQRITAHECLIADLIEIDREVDLGQRRAARERFDADRAHRGGELDRLDLHVAAEGGVADTYDSKGASVILDGILDNKDLVTAATGMIRLQTRDNRIALDDVEAEAGGAGIYEELNRALVVVYDGRVGRIGLEENIVDTIVVIDQPIRILPSDRTGDLDILGHEVLDVCLIGGGSGETAILIPDIVRRIEEIILRLDGDRLEAVYIGDYAFDIQRDVSERLIGNGAAVFGRLAETDLVLAGRLFHVDGEAELDVAVILITIGIGGKDRIVIDPAVTIHGDCGMIGLQDAVLDLGEFGHTGIDGIIHPSESAVDSDADILIGDRVIDFRPHRESLIGGQRDSGERCAEANGLERSVIPLCDRALDCDLLDDDGDIFYLVGEIFARLIGKLDADREKISVEHGGILIEIIVIDLAVGFLPRHGEHLGQEVVIDLMLAVCVRISVSVHTLVIVVDLVPFEGVATDLIAEYDALHRFKCIAREDPDL